MLNVVIYPKCTTCRNAVKWFKENAIAFTERHIVLEALTAKEIEAIHVQSGYPIKRFFNTSGMKYRELGLKDKIDALTLEACYDLLASDGMLVKRPLVYDADGRVTLGFKVAEYEQIWKGR